MGIRTAEFLLPEELNRCAVLPKMPCEQMGSFLDLSVLFLLSFFDCGLRHLARREGPEKTVSLF